MASKSKCILIGAALLSLVIPSLVANGAEISTPKDILLQANAQQWVALEVTGGESLYSMDFFAEVLDAPGGIKGPQMKTIDLLNKALDPQRNTIFSANNTGDQDDLFGGIGGSTPWMAGWTVERGEDLPEVNANGVFAWILFDTKDLFSGTWDFRMFDVGSTEPGNLGDTLMVDDVTFANVLNESFGYKLTIVPEPSSLLLALSGLGIAGAVYAMRRRAGRSRS